jgi:twitching motility protein PilT
MVEKNASDLHVTTGSPPVLRVDDQLIPLRRCAVLTPADTQRLCYSILTEEQRRQLRGAAASSTCPSG